MMWIRRALRLACLVALLTGWVYPAAAGSSLDLSKAVIIIADPDKPVVAKAAVLLQEEIKKRTGITLAVTSAIPSKDTVIVLVTIGAPPAGLGEQPADLAVPDKPEGYAIWLDTTTRVAPAVCLVGHDKRGAIFAVGRLLRSLSMTPGSVTLDSRFRVASAPEYALRGHHVGYDNLNNTFDAWSIEQFEQYCSDLVVFGTNAIELTAPTDPAKKDSPHMKRTMWDMNIDMSRVAGSYGMDVWLFLPTLEKVEDPSIAAQELSKRAALFKALPCLDAVMAPGGDPGDTPLPALLPFLANVAKALRESHPKAGIWLSNQGFEPEKNAALFDYLNREQPDWLAGMVYGPWAKMSLRELRDRTPKNYPIRFYPDITHCVRSQYPVPEWDPAFGHTLGREPFNPRPEAMTRIHNLLMPMSIGSIPYSEGVNDDVNKILWSGLSWDSKTPPKQILQEYGRYFMGDALGDAAASGLADFERNWTGPLLTNKTVPETYAKWHKLEQAADTKSSSSNWRFQLALLRATYDEYVRRRLIEDTAREQKCMDALSKASEPGIAAALASARAALSAPDGDTQIAVMRARLVELGRAIFDSIGMQLDVAHYKALNPERGAVLEFLDTPLNNKNWLNAQFQAIADAPPAEALKRIGAIVKWESPGPGSYYDDLGNGQKQPHLVRQAPWADDPGGVAAPMEEFNDIKDYRLSWEDQAQTLFGTPLRMKYDGLDASAQYTLRVTYVGRFKSTMRLVANGKTEIHGPLKQPDPVAPVEFVVPKAVTSSGALELEWRLVEGRGCQVAEVWLLKE
ncbi:MAG: hypothetical protein HZB26_25370 [Candidatus Hydrogenedentes bacterium]|nr:hypothetical protein [Candidatus Hydrogenedentota bacterium]